MGLRQVYICALAHRLRVAFALWHWAASGTADIQKLALTDDPALADGLKDALAKQREGTNPDGSPRGTAMQEPLRKLQRELAFAATPVERERVQRRMTRELIHSAKEQAGETVDRKADLVI